MQNYMNRMRLKGTKVEDSKGGIRQAGSEGETDCWLGEWMKVREGEEELDSSGEKVWKIGGGNGYEQDMAKRDEDGAKYSYT